MGSFHRACVALALVTCAPIASAQAPLGWAGDGPSATPALRTVGVPASSVEAVGVSAEAGYALTEPVFGGDGAHHRLRGSVAASVRPLPWLIAWLRADGRLDLHPSDSVGQDDGLQGLPRLGVRAGSTLSELVALGAEVELSLPGADAPAFALEALSLEARGLVALHPSDALTFAFLVGFRLDNSGATVPRPVPYRTGDHVALGASDFHALLLGAGVSIRLLPLELIAEITWDALIDVPDLGTAPLRASVGGRLHVARGIGVELGMDLGMTPVRPAIDPSQPLVPIEPRWGAYAAVRVAIPYGPETAAEIDGPEPVPEPAPPPEVVPEPPARGVVLGQVTGGDGRPVGGARVVLTPSGGEPREIPSQADGTYRFTDVPVGPATLRIEAEGHEPAERAIEIAGGENAQQQSQLQESTPRGQLRGMIRSFNGRPLVAHIRVEDLGLEAQSDAEGFFELDVVPGEHVVVIEAAGHTGQRRTVEVPENGVTVLNADLRRGRGGP